MKPEILCPVCGNIINTERDNGFCFCCERGDILGLYREIFECSPLDDDHLECAICGDMVVDCSDGSLYCPACDIHQSHSPSGSLAKACCGSGVS